MGLLHVSLKDFDSLSDSASQEPSQHEPVDPVLLRLVRMFLHSSRYIYIYILMYIFICIQIHIHIYSCIDDIMYSYIMHVYYSTMTGSNFIFRYLFNTLFVQMYLYYIYIYISKKKKIYIYIYIVFAHSSK